MKDLLLCLHVVIKTLNFGNFRLPQRNAVKCVTYVLHDYQGNSEEMRVFVIRSRTYDLPVDILDSDSGKLEKNSSARN